MRPTGLYLIECRVERWRDGCTDLTPMYIYYYPTTAPDELVVSTDKLEVTLRLRRTEAAVASSLFPPLDRLLLAPNDMHRLGVRAGDWVSVVAAASSSSSASNPVGTSDDGALVSTPSQHKRCSTRSEVAVMRAWPATGITLPAGTVRHGECMCRDVKVH